MVVGNLAVYASHQGWQGDTARAGTAMWTAVRSTPLPTLVDWVWSTLGWYLQPPPPLSPHRRTQLCRPYGGPLLRWHPVTPEMSKPGYDKPDAAKVGWNEE